MRELGELLYAARNSAPVAAPSPLGVSAVPPWDGTAAPEGPVIEPLSEWELDVLRLLVEEPGYDQIARLLVLSPNTVKSHIKHIYEKLGANSRREALDRARTLGLLANASAGPKLIY